MLSKFGDPSYDPLRFTLWPVVPFYLGLGLDLEALYPVDGYCCAPPLLYLFYGDYLSIS